MKNTVHKYFHYDMIILQTIRDETTNIQLKGVLIKTNDDKVIIKNSVYETVYYMQLLFKIIKIRYEQRFDRQFYSPTTV